ncbi:MAG: hypothetical protein IPP08_02450 [Chlorobiota bacterium]|nr:hypothetical protein [Chlorobiota bacterium]QQS67054.1 MAG: hypothetical protein IPP08_02450 [Chlorobiota bacterium]
MRLIYSFLLCFLIVNCIQAQSTTWSKDIAPIFYKNCVSCHRAGGIAPFSLTTYNEASSVSALIPSKVLERKMPPWPADPSYRHYVGERRLTDIEIQKIVSWVSDGAPSGDLGQAPNPPIFKDGSELGTPSLSLTMDEYTSEAAKGGNDEYRYFVIPSNLPILKYAKAIELIPGNREIVHHVLVFQDTSRKPRLLDQADPKPGFKGFGGTGSTTTQLIAAWVPGSRPTYFPAGMGIQLLPNTDIILQIHYPAGSIGKKDKTKINFLFDDSPFIRPLFFSDIITHTAPVLQNGPLFIPANKVKTFNAKYTIPFDATITHIAPHMHLIGTKIKSYAVTPTGDTIQLVKINDWDFHWQGNYAFQKLIKLPKGSILYGEATYDNTTNNTHNPNKPPKDVRLGESTTDEMMLIYFAFTLYFNGDENVVIDTTKYSSAPIEIRNNNNNNFLIAPNIISNNQAFAKFDVEINSKATLEFYNCEGKIVQNSEVFVYKGSNTILLNTTDLSPGKYWVLLKVNGSSSGKDLIIE